MKIYMGPYPGIRSKKERRISVRIDDYDVWNFAENLALVILPGLKKLREIKQGAPFVADEDVPEHLRSTAAPPKENEWDTDDNYFLRWDWVMDEMIWAFEQLNTSWEDQFHHGEMESEWVDAGEAAGEKLYQWNILNRADDGPEPGKYWVDQEGMKKHDARIRNGLRLFGVYYQALWD